MKNIFFLVGEPSADAHTAPVLNHLHHTYPEINLWGIGGKKMQKECFYSIYPFSRFNVMGFLEVVRHISFFFNVKKRLKLLFKERKPDLVVLVDYPGFNMRISKMACKMGIKVLYYITPQFWAWKERRKYKLKKFCDKLAVIFPFEEKLLHKINANATYVGHPLNEELEFTLTRKQFAKKYQLSSNNKWLGFIPGSRDSEIKKILPPLVKTIKKLANKNSYNYELLLSRSESVNKSLFNSIIKPVKKHVSVVDETHSLMKYCDFLVCKSGTSSLEAAYIGTPFIVVYKTSFLSYQIAKLFVRINMIAMPNIILGEKMVPELIQNEVIPSTILSNLKTYFQNSKNYEHLKNKLQNVRKKLSGKKPSKNVAKIIGNMIYETNDKV
ncbi:MAG: lipid-A-disaccharide synthase [Candidatus Cloacimonetes bacterium]|nr:lipid-A-disaccharide synthase [Candidatus Cloacimonadota bacterium]